MQRSSIALALVALNLAIGGVVSWLRLPFYLDSIGIVLATVLLGWQYGLLTGALTVGLGSLLINPYLGAYAATMMAIVGTTEFLARRRAFGTIRRSLVSGVILALVAAIVSAPVTTYLFGGVTASGADLVTAIIKASGKTLLTSVALSGLSSELFDKAVVATSAHLVLRALPVRLIRDFHLRAADGPPVETKA